MRIDRERYLKRLIDSRWNGRVKIITGIRRCGKSYLLNILYRDYLLSSGVAPDQIIMLALDNDVNARYRDPLELGKYLRERITDQSKEYYIILDEIQKVQNIENPYLPKGSDDRITFVDVLLGLKDLPNVDIYVTGSNSKMLSSDVITEFRGRGEDIHVSPLTYDEFYAAFPNEKRMAWREYMTYGGLPYVMQEEGHDAKAEYLKDMFNLTYIRDVIDRNRLRNAESTIGELLNVVASNVGSLTNPKRLSNTFKSVKGLTVNDETISNYLDCLSDAFILAKAYRYDVKGNSYIGTPLKYYFTDVGLRNARLNFRQQEWDHIMENVLFNELTARGFNVDVGVVEYNHTDSAGKKTRIWLEVDFVVNRIQKRYYIQSALSVADEMKRKQEVRSLNRIDDSFTKIVVVQDAILPWIDEHGIQYFNIEDFLLDKIDRLD